MPAIPVRAVCGGRCSRHTSPAGTWKPHLQLACIHLPVEVNGLMEVAGKAAIVSRHISPQTLVPPVVCLRLDLYLALYMFLQARGMPQISL